MAIINYFKKEIHIKIVYCGPGLSGKTTNLQWLNQNLTDGKVGKLISLATKTDRTLFFDLMAISLGNIRGFNTRIQLFTTPGQVFYNATRKLVLKGVDGIVFVADSQKPMKAANRESLQNLENNLKDYNRTLNDLPIIIQYNKRDLSPIMSVEELENELNPHGWPSIESSAVTGKGVKETFEAISKISFKSLKEMENLPSAKENNAPVPVITPKEATPQTTPKTGAGSELKIVRCLTPKTLDNGTIQIPMDVYSTKHDDEMRLTLEIRLVTDSKTGKPSLIVNS